MCCGVRAAVAPCHLVLSKGGAAQGPLHAPLPAWQLGMCVVSFSGWFSLSGSARFDTRAFCSYTVFFLFADAFVGPVETCTWQMIALEYSTMLPIACVACNFQMVSDARRLSRSHNHKVQFPRPGMCTHLAQARGLCKRKQPKQLHDNGCNQLGHVCIAGLGDPGSQDTSEKHAAASPVITLACDCDVKSRHHHRYSMP